MSINGDWADAGKVGFDVINPSDGSVLDQVPDGDREVARRAIAAASAFGGMNDSGLGREDSREGIMEYLETKLGDIAI